MGYTIIILSGVCDVGSENHSKISGHMTSGDREFLIPVSAVGYSIIVPSGVCDGGSENHSKISGHMTSGEREFLIPISAGFWRKL